MDFGFDEDQESLRTAARRLFAEHLTGPRESDEGAGDDGAALWGAMTALGWVAVSAPSGGGTFLDDAVLLEEAGYALAPVPLLSTVTATPALVQAGAAVDTATAIAWGEPPGAAAFTDPADLTCAAERTASGYQLSGRKTDVPDLPGAQLCVVVATEIDAGEGAPQRVPALALVDLRHGPPLTVTDRVAVDRTRPVGELTLDHTPGAVVGAPGVLAAVRRRGLAGLAVESVGVAQRAVELATAHANTREQFGRPIGSYQAVAHRIADSYVAVELARSLAYRAAWYVSTAETHPGQVTAEEVDDACSAAKACATSAAVHACESLIQILGGIGMTWEHVAHRYYKRALGNRGYGGTPAAHRAAIAAALLDT